MSDVCSKVLQGYGSWHSAQPQGPGSWYDAGKGHSLGYIPDEGRVRAPCCGCAKSEEWEV